jgi:hypothetical protein
VATDSGEGLGGPEPHKPPPPSYTVCIHCTVYVYTLLRAPTTVYVLIHTRLNQREGMRGNTSQSWVKNKKMTFCRGIITAPSHAKLKVRYPPPPKAFLRMRGGTHMLTHVHLFVLPTVNRPFKLNIYTVLYCPPFCSIVLFMPPPHFIT